jgi:hypothetical protein
VDFWEKLESVELRPLDTDHFVWRWTPDSTYSIGIVHESLLPGRELWKASTPLRVKFFFGLLFTVEFGRVTVEIGMVSRIQRIVRSTAKKMRGSTTC